MAFDEQAYLAANPDVAAHVAAGGGSAYDHYQQYGQAEGRSLAPAAATVAAPAAQPNWSSGAGYATNVSAPVGTGAYYSQLNDAWGAYKAGSGVNPITGKKAAEESGTWWNPGAGASGVSYGNYMMQPDIAMNYMVNAAAKGVRPEDYVTSHADMSIAGGDTGRGGILPTGQTVFERMLGQAGGTSYNIYGGVGGSPNSALLDPYRGIRIGADDAARYQKTFGTAAGNVGSFGGLDPDKRQAQYGSLTSAFNSLGSTASGGATGSPGTGGTASRPGATSAPGGGSYAPSGGSSSGGSSFTSSGSPSLGFNLSNVAGPSQWDVSGNQTVANQLTSLLASDNPLIQQARARAMQQSNARGLSNSSIAQTAGDAAAYDAMLQIAKQDASTNATAAQSNTAAQNQFTTDANAFLRNGYMADFNLSANEWAAQQDFARQQQLARLQAELDAGRTTTQQKDSLQQGYINALNQARTAWSDKYAALMADPNMSPENKTSALTSLAASYNTQIRQYTGLLGWDYGSWDIEYKSDAPVAAAPVATTAPVTP